MNKITKRYKQFEDLIIADFETRVWEHPRHNHNHYEIIYIARGEGVHELNEVEQRYHQGDLFLLGPEDAHEFRVEQLTRFIYFKFTKSYLKQGKKLFHEDWTAEMDRQLNDPERKRGNLLQYQADRVMVFELMQLILREYLYRPAFTDQIIFNFFSVILLIIRRNREVSADRIREVYPDGITERILGYIEQNIRTPKKLTLGQLSEHFHYSSNYIGILFKQNMGSSLREYIGNYRFQLVQQRIRYSQVGMKQIAAEFGFVDESHLSKFIKQHSNKRASQAQLN